MGFLWKDLGGGQMFKACVGSPKRVLRSAAFFFVAGVEKVSVPLLVAVYSPFDVERASSENVAASLASRF